jgi:hypothetical protein
MGTRYFTVVEMKKDRIVLKNENGTFEFSRYTKPSGTDNSQSTSSARANNEVAGPVDQALLAEKWETFKRTSAVKQDHIDYIHLLKSIDITITGKKLPVRRMQPSVLPKPASGPLSAMKVAYSTPRERIKEASKCLKVVTASLCCRKIQ